MKPPICRRCKRVLQLPSMFAKGNVKMGDEAKLKLGCGHPGCKDNPKAGAEVLGRDLPKKREPVSAEA